MASGPAHVWAAIAVIAVIVAVLRWVFLLLPREWQPRGLLAQALSHAPLAALAALVAPQVMAPLLEPTADADLLARLADPRLLSAVVAIACVQWRRNVFAGVLAGIVVYVLLVALR